MASALSIQVAPPGDGKTSAAIIADVHRRCMEFLRDGKSDELVREADTLSLFTTRGNSASTRLFSIRLWKVDALIRLGRGREAIEFLGWLESFNGISFQTRQRMALLYSFAGEHEAAVGASADALIALPLAKTPSLDYRRAAQQYAEALCASGRQPAARAFLVDALRGLTPNYDDLAVLRRTVNSRESLDEFFNYLLPFFSYPGHRARLALFHYSVACRDFGDMPRAILTARQRFLAGLQIVTFGGREKPSNEYWSRDAAGALLDLRTDLKALGLDFFLISGTLLGCVRERGIIGHDKDVDTGVFTDMPAADLRRALASTGRFKTKPLTTDKLVQVMHSNGVMIDVFIHWREDGVVYHEGQKAAWWNSDFNLQEVEFLGFPFMIPTSPERYLDENYGVGWRTPDPEFETFVDTPNMMIQDRDHMIWYYYTKLLDYYFAGKPIQLSKVWQALSAIIPEDPMVRAAVSRAMVEVTKTEAHP